MNMIANQDFTDAQGASDLEKTKGTNPNLARLMKAWESKQASTARKAGGFGFMAVSLAACGGSDNDNDAETPDVSEVGSIFNLSIGDDNITGTAFADTFNATLASATGSLTGVLGLQTLGDTDVINGGEGVDTLNAVLNGTGLAILSLAAPFITDVEIYNLTARNDAGGLDLNNSTGFTQLWNINSSGDLTLVNVEEAAAIGLRGTEGGTTYSVQYTSAAAADIVQQLVIANGIGGSTASGQFTTLNVADSSEDDDGIVDMNLVVSNGVRLILEGSVANIENFDIDGSGLLVLDAQGNFENLVMLDADGYTGDLSLDVSGSDDLTAVLTGSGDDIIAINNGVMNGDLSVDLGAGADILVIVDNGGEDYGSYGDYGNLSSFGGHGSFDEEEISDLDFTGGVANTENIAFGDDVSTYGSGEYGAVLDLTGVDADLEAVWFFDGIGAYGDFAIANSPVEDLSLNAQDLLGDDEDVSFFVDDLDTGNIVNLTINADGDLDIFDLNAPSLQTLTLNQLGVDSEGDALGNIDFEIDSDEEHDLSALQSITATAAGDADIGLDADDEDADMNALTSVTIVAGEEAELEMDGVPAQRQVQEISVDWDTGTPTGGSIELIMPTGETVDFVFGDDTAAINEKLEPLGYTAVLDEGKPAVLTITRTEFGPADRIEVGQFILNGTTGQSFTNAVIEAGVAPESFSGLETIDMSGEEIDVDLDDVHGNFTLDVTATGVELDDDADVDVDNTGVTTITVTVSDAVVYERDVEGEALDYIDSETGRADIDISDNGNDSGYGNPFLTNLTVSGAMADVDLDGDLSSLTVIDLTGVVVEFDVDASEAIFADGVNISYLIGGTSSELEDGDSSLNLSDTDAREIITFTSADVGTVVINGFVGGSSDQTDSTDRLDLSELGFTQYAQLDVDRGDYDDITGVFTADIAGEDLRITDADISGGSLAGEIILTDISEVDLQSNILYA